MAYRSVHVFKYDSRNKVRIHEMSSTIEKGSVMSSVPEVV